MKNTASRRPRAGETRTTHSGHCPVCFRVQKLERGDRMVFHGFRRPGDGATYGDCLGTGYPAYEVSDEGCREYRGVRLVTKQVAEDRFRFLSSPKLDKLSVLGKDKAGNTVTITVRPGDKQWSIILREETRLAEAQREGSVDEIKRMDALIKNWKRRDVLTEEEAVEAKVTPEKVAARDARAEAKAAKEAKATALAAKRADKEAKLEAMRPQLEALILKFRSEIDKLAQNPTDENRIKALNIVREAIKPKNQKFGEIWGMHIFSKEASKSLFPYGYYLNDGDAENLARQKR